MRGSGGGGQVGREVGRWGGGGWEKMGMEGKVVERKCLCAREFVRARPRVRACVRGCVRTCVCVRAIRSCRYIATENSCNWATDHQL